MREPPTINLSCSPDCRTTTKLAFGRDSQPHAYYDSSAITQPLTDVPRVTWWMRVVMWWRRHPSA